MPDDRSLVSCPRDAFPDGTDVLVHAPPPARRNLFVRLAKLGKASSRRCENGEQCRRGHPRPKPKKLNRSVLLDAHAEPTEAPSPRIRRRLGHGGRVRLDNKSPAGDVQYGGGANFLSGMMLFGNTVLATRQCSNGPTFGLCPRSSSTSTKAVAQTLGIFFTYASFNAAFRQSARADRRRRH